VRQYQGAFSLFFFLGFSPHFSVVFFPSVARARTLPLPPAFARDNRTKQKRHPKETSSVSL
jgi:hypothetical protein